MKKKNQILTVILFLTTLCITAQPTIEWQKCLGGTGEDYGTSIQQTSDGGYIVAGYSGSTDGDVTGNHGSYDYWVVKLDSSSVITWQKSLGGSNIDEVYSIQQTIDGGYIIAGQSSSNNGDVTSNQGWIDYWVVKLTSAGTIEWQKSLGGTGYDYLNSIQQTLDGGYIVAGNSNSNDGDVSGNHGSYDYWVVKLTSLGDITWQKCIGGMSEDDLYSIQQTSDGGYIVAGQSNSNDGDVSGNQGWVDYWVVKLTNTGTIEWQKSLGGTGYDLAQSIKQTADGGYIVAGGSDSNNGDVTGNHGSYDSWVVKLTSSGAVTWQKSFGGTGSDNARSIQQTSDGGYVFSGYSQSNNGDVTGNQGWTDYWVVKLNSIGTIEWQKCLGGANEDLGTSIQQTLDGGFIVAGYAYSTNGDVTGNHGSYDYWVVKLSAEVGVNEIAEQNLFSVFPNPATNQINIKVEAKLIGAVYTVYDNMGKKVLSGKLNTEKTVIELGNLSSGMYLFSVGENRQQTFKVVKE